jgi:RNA-directed DNA polymerase
LVARLTVLLAELGLKPNLAKTRTVKLHAGGEGVDFLGFHHRLVRFRFRQGRGEFTYLGPLAFTEGDAASPRLYPVYAHEGSVCCSGRGSRGGHQYVPARVGGLFSMWELRPAFDEIRKYTVMRLALFVAERHQRGRNLGSAQLYRSRMLERPVGQALDQRRRRLSRRVE